MQSKVSLVIFEGGLVESKLEKQMQKVRQGMVFDLLAKAKAGGYQDIIVVTSYPELAKKLITSEVTVHFDQNPKTPFHFGQRLLEVVEQYKLDKVLYLGGAAAPLLSSLELQQMREILEQSEDVFLANNYYSADIIGFAPGHALKRITLPPIDNTLALALGNEGGLRWVPLQRSLGLNFDVDTPTDVLIMSVHPELGPQTRKAVEQVNWDRSPYLELRKLLNDPNGELLIYGRIGSNLFKYLDEHSRCRIRLFSEERGMKALGRDQRGEVQGLVGRLIQELGYQGFFEFLSQIVQGAVLDTRVIFEHFKWELSSADRFASDLGKTQLIEHTSLREFTQAALDAPIPILLGGHSLVAGGLWALVDAGLKSSN